MSLSLLRLPLLVGEVKPQANSSRDACNTRWHSCHFNKFVHEHETLEWTEWEGLLTLNKAHCERPDQVSLLVFQWHLFKDGALGNFASKTSDRVIEPEMAGGSSNYHPIIPLGTRRSAWRRGVTRSPRRIWAPEERTDKSNTFKDHCRIFWSEHKQE